MIVAFSSTQKCEQFARIKLDVQFNLALVVLARYVYVDVKQLMQKQVHVKFNFEELLFSLLTTSHLT